LKLGGPEVWGYFYEVDESVNKIATIQNGQALKENVQHICIFMYFSILT